MFTLVDISSDYTTTFGQDVKGAQIGHCRSWPDLPLLLPHLDRMRKVGKLDTSAHGSGAPAAKFDPGAALTKFEPVLTKFDPATALSKFWQILLSTTY